MSEGRCRRIKATKFEARPVSAAGRFLAGSPFFCWRQGCRRKNGVPENDYKAAAGLVENFFAMLWCGRKVEKFCLFVKYDSI